ncbi:hypothetical protein PoB_004936700 [Plakobranchus ocellatus]|uniref:Uncharacterized protein n=1 Tax=Plakobranchus ocellatus TaxID=259542 RepID=A0AAV4BV14_9GAST|nr:hypothetical protein PoB_004936700 [Plakobranchus ocellatus]
MESSTSLSLCHDCLQRYKLGPQSPSPMASSTSLSVMTAFRDTSSGHRAPVLWNHQRPLAHAILLWEVASEYIYLWACVNITTNKLNLNKCPWRKRVCVGVFEMVVLGV